uniref:Uncharacterized protein n=1 Tax=viral metagenome TaxID=1070528 RepID=A0A6C0IJG9_9ZZZZ
MNNSERIHLQKMIHANNVEDCTNEIREKKHSQKIYVDVTRLLELKTKYEKTIGESNPQKFDDMCVAQCSFLFNNYTDIFNKVKKNEMNLQILLKLIEVLKNIEEGLIDQHTGAFEVGKILKAMYIDSALLKAEKIDKKTGEKMATVDLVEAKKISWKEFKDMQEQMKTVE